jgi:hypothetical protein
MSKHKENFQRIRVATNAALKKAATAGRRVPEALR